MQFCLVALTGLLKTLSTPRASLLLGLLVVFVLPRATYLHHPPTLGNDEAAYASLARDYKETGTFSESLTSDSYGYFLPVAYPFAVAWTATISGLPVDRAGQVVSLLATLVIALVAFSVIAQRGHPRFPVFLACAGLVLLAPMVFYSLSLFTEMAYLAVAFLLIWALERLIRSDWAWTWALASGALAGVAYSIRFGALMFVVPAILLALAGSLAVHRRFKSRKFALAVALYLAPLGVALTLNALRLEAWNGRFQWVPQAGGTSAESDFLASGNPTGLWLYRLGENGEIGFKNAITGTASNPSPPTAFNRIASIATRLPGNLSENLKLMFKGWLGAKLWPLGALLAAMIALLWWRRRHHPNQPAATLILLMGAAMTHIGGYSLFFAWPRYAEEALPFFYTALVLMAFHMSSRRLTLFLILLMVSLTAYGSRQNRSALQHKYSAAALSRTREMARMLEGQTSSSLSASFSYYAGSRFQLFPFAEDREELLFKWIARKGVTRIQCPQDFNYGSHPVSSPACRSLKRRATIRNSGITALGPDLYNTSGVAFEAGL